MVWLDLLLDSSRFVTDPVGLGIVSHEGFKAFCLLFCFSTGAK